MLTTVYIENIAVIEKAEIVFSEGLNVLTGETGAGKSIVIDAINMILGRRTSKDIIRTGSSSAFVSAAFENIGDEAVKTAELLGFSCDDGVLILQRELNQNGKNTCRINSRPATVTALRELGKKLIAIHGQSESYELLTPDVHMDYLDGLAGNQSLLSEYRFAYNELKEISRKLESSQTDSALRMQQMDLLRYQTRELNDAQLVDGEYEELTAERDMLLNSEKITNALFRGKSALIGAEDFQGALELVENAASDIKDAAESWMQLEPIASRLLDLYYGLEDCVQEIESVSNQMENDPARLEQVEERLDLIYRLSRKYGPTVSNMLEFLESAQKKLDELEKYDENRDALTIEFKRVNQTVNKLAGRLSKIRHDTSIVFSEKVKKELEFLDMPNVKFIASVTDTDLNEKGANHVEFLVSANRGEPAKPVSKIASGGELSRIMLAVKNVLSESETLSTMIFDEVDAGISGSAALKVGLKLKSLSSSRQIICITHQAQIAALADNHYYIEKNVRGERTFTTVSLLDFDKRKYELARIIGGREITDTALAHAEELLKQK